MARPSIEHVASPKKWRVLLSPVRAEIAEGLRCIGPCSIAELAALVDRPADALYRHIEQLQRAGFVVKAGLRKKGRHVEQLIDVVADDFQIAFTDNTGREENRAIVETARTVLRAAERAVTDSAAARQLELRLATRNLSILYELSWLTPAAFQRVRALVAEIKTIFVDGRLRREGRLYLAVGVTVPVTRRRRSKERVRAQSAERTAGKSHARPAPKQSRTLNKSSPRAAAKHVAQRSSRAATARASKSKARTKKSAREKTR